ncbi:unnamed protein product [Cylindrotheca closterium]|uniref:Uncharacterized protein n=1 Tax=Cylindrotheca closterium TaxID=2856 RepID=A0AAD2FQG3_9STRA|nr:unnamed protein product [Cylindrotheca closterium]
MIPQAQPTSIGSNQFIKSNYDASILQSSQRAPTIRSPLLQMITNSEERCSLFGRKLMSPIEVQSSSSQQQVENRQSSPHMTPTVMENNCIIINCQSVTSSNFMVLPWSPVSASKKSYNGSHLIATPNSQRKSTPEVAYPQIAANHVSQNVLSATVETDPKRWTVEEDNVLAMAVESHNGRVTNWNLLAFTFFAGSRTGSMCKARWRKTTVGSKIRGNWMPEEDAKISQLKSEGFSWRYIATQCPGRSYEQVISRYRDNLDPSVLKTPWTAPEDSILIQEQSRVGNKWKQMAQLLPGRSTNQVKNRWYHIQQSERRKQRKSSSVKKTRRKVEVQSRPSGHLSYSMLTNPWTESEDNILIQEHSRVGKKWKQISQLLPRRTPDQVRNRWTQILHRLAREKQTKLSSAKKTSDKAEVQCPDNDQLDPSIVKTPRCWTEAEDSILIQEHSRIGNQWTQISKLLPGRSPEQVRNRSIQIQRRRARTTPWTASEDGILIQEQSLVGNQWTQISKLLPGRSKDQVKNRWQQIQRLSGLEKQTKLEISRQKYHIYHADPQHKSGTDGTT